MSTPSPVALPANSVREQVSDAEWQARVDLAACYRLVALEGWTDLTATHISARVPGEDAFLLNPLDVLFEEITASSLVKMDFQRNKLLENGYSFNPAGFTIHSAVLSGRPDVVSALHTHTVNGMAISAIETGLLPITQHALMFYDNLGYHDYEGIALDQNECQRLIDDLGQAEGMILRNHGLLTVGKSVASAFVAMYYLEKSCASQLQAMQTGAKLVIPSAEVCRHTRQQYSLYESEADDDWPTMLRRVDRELPGYAV
ncbi:MAG: class II aldolase/adducin family protein [Rhodospirillales bacterium]